MSHGPLLTINDRSILHSSPVDHGTVYLTASRHFNPTSQTMEVRFSVVHVEIANLNDLEHPAERVIHMDSTLLGAMEVYNVCVKPANRIPAPGWRDFTDANPEPRWRYTGGLKMNMEEV